MPLISKQKWHEVSARFPVKHLLQTANWATLKESFGWQAKHVYVGQSGAQILFRRLPLGFSMGYIPKGPLGENWSDLWPEIDALCRSKRAIILKVEPDLWQDSPDDPHATPPPGFFVSPHAIQPPRTLLVDLTGDEGQILGRMKQKTRYNIGLARRKGVQIKPSDDIETFYRLLQITGQRDNFAVRSLAYYRLMYELFKSQGLCELLLAEFEGQPLAGLMVFACNRRALYLVGGSTHLHRNRMPNYLLQWEAMRWARAQGCEEFDLWGVPDEPAEILESEFIKRADGLWGVYRFKRGFGGQLRRAAGPWDKVYQPLLYRFYRFWVGTAAST